MFPIFLIKSLQYNVLLYHRKPAIIKEKFFMVKGDGIMIVTTTTGVEGKKIIEYKGLVFGEVVAGVNFIKDFMSSITDVIGGRSGTIEGEMAEARDKAVAEMVKRAEKMGADAVIGVDIDYEVLGEKNGMLMVSTSGTAVKLED